MICKTLTRQPYAYTTSKKSEMSALLPLFYLVQLISLAFLQKHYLTLDAKRCLTGQSISHLGYASTTIITHTS